MSVATNAWLKIITLIIPSAFYCDIKNHCQL